MLWQTCCSIQFSEPLPLPYQESILIPKTHVGNEAIIAQYMTACQCVQEFKLDDAKIWFIRMSLSARCNILACGNTQGQVYLWDMLALTEGPQAILRRGNSAKSGKIGRPNINSTVRTCVVYTSRVWKSILGPHCQTLQYTFCGVCVACLKTSMLSQGTACPTC